MDGAELSNLASRDILLAPRWGGVFAVDQFPKNLQDGFIYVLSDQPSHVVKTHWRLISTIGPHIYFFCSYGTPPKNKKVILSLRKLGKPLIYNTRQLQLSGSQVCGLHVIFLAILLVRDFSLSSIIRNFYSSNLLKNDLMVSSYISVCLRARKSVPQIFSSESRLKNDSHEKFQEVDEKKSKNRKKISNGPRKKIDE